ncbi:hypothetical protein BDN72DRAFT_733516, partial [Pluteus cervinus]
VLYSPNSTRRPELPWNGTRRAENTTIFDSQFPYLERYQHPLWWTRSHGWLAFVPISPDLLSVPFDVLLSFPVPVQNEEALYSLPADVISQWQNLEQFLYYSTAYMIKEQNLPAIRPYTPSAFKYDQKISNIHTAQRRIHLARDWFIIWGALFSFLACSGDNNTSVGAIPPWCEYLPKHGIHPDWVHAAQCHPMGELQISDERAGVFISLLNSDPNQPSVEWFVERRVPVWYY